MPAAGDLSLFLPGCEPAEIRSGVDVADGQWHYVAAAFDETARRSCTSTASWSKKRRSSAAAPAVRRRRCILAAIRRSNIGCDGLVDEVRISNVLRTIDGVPTAPLEADAATVGLWHFDRLERDRVEDLSPATSNAA